MKHESEWREVYRNGISAMSRWTPFALLIPLLVSPEPAPADIVFGPASGKAMVPVYIYTGAGGANGADTTEDQCLSMAVPAFTTQNIGDTIVVYAAGNFAGTTDNKNARIRLTSMSGAVMSNLNGTTVANQVWATTVLLTKTGAPGTTTYIGMALGAMGGASGGSNVVSTNITDTAPWNIIVTGQDSTAATANAVTCKYLSVWVVKGP